MEHSDIQVARRVLAKEVEGITSLSEALGSEFIAAIDLIVALKGRVIISGMGKSGHIARKIAATFSSTGTPAFFVHPGEASHGDMGMIAEQDAVILLSNSGETHELKDIIRYVKRFGIPLIGIARRKQSHLIQEADIPFVLPAVPEASDINAPTTSTTMMLALGDALAVALSERKGFSREDYHVFHPGGMLGAAFTRVIDVMHKQEELPLVGPETLMSEALLVMTSGRFGCVGVTDKTGKLLGIVTDGDLRRHMQPDLLGRTAQEMMTADPVTIRPQALIEEALHVMNTRAITTLFVVEQDNIQGIVHIHDCLRVY